MFRIIVAIFVWSFLTASPAFSQEEVSIVTKTEDALYNYRSAHNYWTRPPQPTDPQPIDFFWNPKVLELCEAITNENLVAIERLIQEEKVNPNARGLGGLTPTMWAFQESKKSFEKMLELKGDPNLRLFSDSEYPVLLVFRRGESLVHAAARSGDEEYLILVLKHGGFPGQRPNIPKSDENFLYPNALTIALESSGYLNAKIILEHSHSIAVYENSDFFKPEVKDILELLCIDRDPTTRTNPDRILLMILEKGLKWQNPNGETLIFNLVNRYNALRVAKYSHSSNKFSYSLSADVSKESPFFKLVDWFVEQGIDIPAIADKYPELRSNRPEVPKIEYKNTLEVPYVFDPERLLRRFQENRNEWLRAKPRYDYLPFGPVYDEDENMSETKLTEE